MVVNIFKFLNDRISTEMYTMKYKQMKLQELNMQTQYIGLTADQTQLKKELINLSESSKEMIQNKELGNKAESTGGNVRLIWTQWEGLTCKPPKK